MSPEYQNFAWSAARCVQHSVAALFCENFAMFYFDAKHLEKGLDRKWWNFWSPFLQKEKKKNAHFGQYWKLPKFSRLNPVYHNNQLYDLLMVCPLTIPRYKNIRNTAK